ncbi:MAG: hypothetical protein AAFU85_13065, partial [Planctomycetota bacterium]
RAKGELATTSVAFRTAGQGEILGIVPIECESAVEHFVAIEQLSDVAAQAHLFRIDGESRGIKVAAWPIDRCFNYPHYSLGVTPQAIVTLAPDQQTLEYRRLSDASLIKQEQLPSDEDHEDESFYGFAKDCFVVSSPLRGMRCRDLINRRWLFDPKDTSWNINPGTNRDLALRIRLRSTALFYEVVDTVSGAAISTVPLATAGFCDWFDESHVISASKANYFTVMVNDARSGRVIKKYAPWGWVVPASGAVLFGLVLWAIEWMFLARRARLPASLDVFIFAGIAVLLATLRNAAFADRGESSTVAGHCIIGALLSLAAASMVWFTFSLDRLGARLFGASSVLAGVILVERFLLPGSFPRAERLAVILLFSATTFAISQLAGIWLELRESFDPSEKSGVQISIGDLIGTTLSLAILFAALKDVSALEVWHAGRSFRTPYYYVLLVICVALLFVGFWGNRWVFTVLSLLIGLIGLTLGLNEAQAFRLGGGLVNNLQLELKLAVAAYAAVLPFRLRGWTWKWKRRLERA